LSCSLEHIPCSNLRSHFFFCSHMIEISCQACPIGARPNITVLAEQKLSLNSVSCRSSLGAQQTLMHGTPPSHTYGLGQSSNTHSTTLPNSSRSAFKHIAPNLRLYVTLSEFQMPRTRSCCASPLLHSRNPAFTKTSCSICLPLSHSDDLYPNARALDRVSESSSSI